VALDLAPPAARFNLRIDPVSAEAASRAFGLALPDAIGRQARRGGRAALRLGPDEWSLWAPEGEAEAVEAAFAAIDGDAPHSLVDVSDRETAISLDGARSAELLSVGCPIDLDALAVGAGTRTVFEGVQVVLRREAETRWTLEVGRSFAPFVWELLVLADRELASGL
jgi:sarcosine oxidase subunit gamma